MVAEKVPVPLDVQAVPALFVALAPDTILTCPEPEQTEKFEPATAVGAGVIVNVFVEVALVHPVFAVAVNVSITLPALISPALGV